jgi:hypothetical protein
MIHHSDIYDWQTSVLSAASITWALMILTAN